MADFTVSIPELTTVNNVQLHPDSKTQLANALAPTLTHLVEAAGMTLTPAQLADLQNAFVERGTINIAPSAAAADATISVEVNSLNYASKQAQIRE